MRHIIITLLCIVNTGLFAQKEEIKIWPGKIPGAKKNETYKESVILKDNKFSRAFRVTDPTLIPYIVSENMGKGVAVIICPGGGYGALMLDYEGSSIAEMFNQMGVSAFVLKYRLPNDTIMEDKSVGPLQDAQEALRIVRRNAVKWRINPSKIGIIGFSAGGHLASTLSTHYNDKVYQTIDSTSARPDFSILIYAVITLNTSYTDKGTRERLIGKLPDPKMAERFSNELQVNAHTPPAFLVHSSDDKVVSVQNSINYYLALKNAGVPSEIHIFERGGHGYGLAINKGSESAWPELLKKWLKTNDIL
jgi:acetyl esterase/lipase